MIVTETTHTPEQKQYLAELAADIAETERKMKSGEYDHLTEDMIDTADSIHDEAELRYIERAERYYTGEDRSEC